MEHDDGSVNNKTVCSKVRCDSNDIEDQRVRIVCTSPPGAGATGSVIVKLAPSFNPTAFTRVPGDYTFFASTAIASVSPKSLSPKGSVVTLRINTEVPARNVLCRFGHKQHLPPFKWEGGITVAAVGHPLAAEAALTLEKVDNGTAKPSTGADLPFPFNQVVKCVGPTIDMKEALAWASERALKKLPQDTLLETSLAVSMDGGATWSVAKHLVVENAPVIDEESCGGLVCGSHGSRSRSGSGLWQSLRASGYSLVEIAADNLGTSGTGEYRCRFGADVVKAERLNVTALACFSPPRGNTCGSKGKKPSAADATPLGKPCAVRVAVSSNGGETFSSTAATVMYGPMPIVTKVSSSKGRAGDSYWAEIDNMAPGIDYWFKFGLSMTKATNLKAGNATTKTFQCRVPENGPTEGGNDVSVSNNGIVFVPSGHIFEYAGNKHV